MQLNLELNIKNQYMLRKSYTGNILTGKNKHPRTKLADEKRLNKRTVHCYVAAHVELASSVSFDSIFMNLM